MPFVRLRTIEFVFLLFIAASSTVAAQSPLPTTGTRFSFAVPEGADNLVDANTGSTDSSKLYLYFVSSTAGTATIWSPSGYSKTISFCKDTATVFELPYYLMHLHDVGKTNKGILVETSVPVQLVFHDYFQAGGEVTQLYPDEALDTSYTIATWGLYNDQSYNWSTGTFTSENNKTEFVITAPYDSTIVTIRSAVAPIGIPGGAFPSITIRLDRGEAYMIKADSTSLPTKTSLTGSKVSSTKPVSVISASTCGYVPALPTEACNELLNMELPKRFTDTIYYTAGFSGSPLYALLFISDTPSFFVITSGGLTYQTNTGVLFIPLVTQPQQCFITAPAKCYQLSVGTGATGSYGLSDPSIFNVLPRSLYLDSLEWYSPANLGIGQYSVQFISIIYPQTAESQILLDGLPILPGSALPQPIFGTSYSTIIVQVPPGVHKLTSPEPVYAYASGFDLADSYSYNLTGILPPSKTIFDTVRSGLDIDTTAAVTCHDFIIPVRLIKDDRDNLSRIHGELQYDKQLASIISVEPKTIALANTFVSTITTPGVLSFDLTGFPINMAGDTICLLHFLPSGKNGGLNFILHDTLQAVVGDCFSVWTRTQLLSKSLSIQEIRDTVSTAFSISIDSANPGEIATASFDLIKALADSITSLTITLTYDHDLLELMDIPGTTHPDAQTDQFTIDFNPPYDGRVIGELLTIRFKVYVSRASLTTISASFSIANRRECPLDILAPQATTIFGMRDSCSTILLRQQLNGSSIKITRIVPNPVTENMSIEFDRPLPSSVANLCLINVLGQTVRQWSEAISADQSILHSPKLSDLSPGAYFYEITIDGMKFSGSFLLRN